jgi:hypothetical protein
MNPAACGLRLRRFSFSEKEGDRIDPCKSNKSKNNPAHHFIGSAEYAGDQVISEKPNQPPVDRADYN